MPFENDSIPRPIGRHVLSTHAFDSIYGKADPKNDFFSNSIFSSPVPTRQPSNTHVVSPEQMFGEKSTLVMAYSSKNSLGAGIPRKYPMDTPWSFALIFALPLLAMLLIYYSRGYLKRIPLLLVNIKAAHKEYREGQQNLNRTLSLLAWFSLVPATFLIIYLLRNYASSLEHNVGLSAIPIVVGIILAYIALKHSVLYIASVLTFSKEFTRELLYNGGLFVGAWGFISFFFVLLLFIYDGKQLDILLYIVALLCILFILLYLVRTLQLFLTEKISLFFWILYLCTLEISPVLLVINYLYPTK